MLCWSGLVKRKKKSGSIPVYLNVYDLTPMNTYGYWLGLGVFHSGVQGFDFDPAAKLTKLKKTMSQNLKLDFDDKSILHGSSNLADFVEQKPMFLHGVEYAFGAHESSNTGIFEVEPKKCPGFTFRKSILVGKTDLVAKEVRVFMEKLAEEYKGNKYHLITRNCNHFCNEVCLKLTQKQIPRWVNRLARLGVLCNCVLPPRLNESKVRRVGQGELSVEEKKKLRNRTRSGSSSMSSTPDNHHRTLIRTKSNGNNDPSSSSSGLKKKQKHRTTKAPDQKSPSVSGKS